jgi:hypothetical protein
MEYPGRNDALECLGPTAEHADPADGTPMPHVLCQPWRVTGRGNTQGRKAAALEITRHL